MTIKLELTEERTQRELSEEEWAFPIWRWAAFSLFETTTRTWKTVYKIGAKIYNNRLKKDHQ